MHAYKALIINCMDPRLQGENEIKIARHLGLHPGEYEILTYPGPSLWMTDPHQISHAANFWWELENVSLKVHGIKSVAIIGHSECGGFALKGAPQEYTQERHFIIESLKLAEQSLKSRHPEVRIKLVFVKIGPDTGDDLPEIYPEIIE